MDSSQSISDYDRMFVRDNGERKYNLATILILKQYVSEFFSISFNSFASIWNFYNCASVED